MTKSFVLPFVLLAMVSASAGPAGEPIDRALAGEIRRVREEVPRVIPEDQRETPTARLDRASAAIEGSRRYLALYELEPVWESTAAFGFGRRQSAIADLDAFTRLWTGTGEPPEPAASGPTSLPAIVEAIAASAETRGPALYRASRPYAQDAGLPAGLYYLGESRAVGAFAAFARTLAWAPAGPRPALRSIAAELDAFEAEVTQAYAAMAREQHPAYMFTSIALKRARSLNAQGRFEGALLEYLVARYRFAPLRDTAAAAAPDPAKVEHARESLPADRDHSIAILFLEMADAALASSDPAARRGAAFVTDEVLPAYRAVLGSSNAPASLTATPSASATITLVRWPFT